VGELGNDLPRYETTLREKLKSLRLGMARSSLVDKATSTLKGLSKELETQPSNSAPKPVGQSTDPARPIAVEIHSPPERTLDTYQRVMSALLAPLTTTGLVLLLVIFILLQREDIRDRVIRLVGAGDIERTTTALNDAASRLSRLLLAQTAMNAGFGVVITAGLWAIGVPSPVLWGGIAALMRFIPYIGSIFAAVFPLLLAAAIDPGWSMLLWTLALFVIVEPIVGHLIKPWV
jgi:predicted PurR-regulated permease PerM